MTNINIVNGKEYSVYIDGTNSPLFTGCAQNSTDLKDTFIKNQQEEKARLKAVLNEEEDSLVKAKVLIETYIKEFKKQITVTSTKVDTRRTLLGRVIEKITEQEYDIPKYIKDERNSNRFGENKVLIEGQVYKDKYIRDQENDYDIEQHVILKLECARDSDRFYLSYSMCSRDISVNIAHTESLIKEIEDTLSSKLIVVEKRNTIKAPKYELILQEQEE